MIKKAKADSRDSVITDLRMRLADTDMEVIKEMMMRNIYKRIAKRNGEDVKLWKTLFWIIVFADIARYFFSHIGF